VVDLGPGMLPEGVSTPEAAAAKILAAKEAKVAKLEIAQQAQTAEALKNVHEEATNPLAAFKRKTKDLKDHTISVPKEEKAEEKQKVLPDRQVRDQASKFEKRNGELKSDILLLLLDKVKDCRDKDELLKILNDFYPDPTVADEALDFLLATTLGSLKEIVKEAKEAFNEQRGREIEAGKNINEQVQQYVELGLGTPSKLRDLYRDLTGNPRDPVALFLELGDRFNYKEMRKVLAYLFHAMGADLKSQGPSIPPGLLHRLLTEVRNLQAGLGIMRFFRSRMKLIAFLFQKNGLDVPPELTFETMSRSFVSLLQERYPSPEKVLQLSQKLGITKEILAKIVVFSQMRDAIREIAFYHFYRSLQHRDEIYKSILEALEQLEEELDELFEEEYEEEDLFDEGAKEEEQKEPELPDTEDVEISDQKEPVND